MIAQRIKDLQPYIPGEQPDKLRDGREYIKLNANENPYPPSPLVVRALSAVLQTDFGKAARYPDPDSKKLCQAIAALLNVTGGTFCQSPHENRLSFELSPDMIFTGNGSDEVLSFVFYSFFDADRPLVLPEHTYSFYPVYAGYYGIPLRRVPLKPDFSPDIDALLNAANATNSSIILANPNAPTGIPLSKNELIKLLQNAPKDRVVVIDEAYADFATVNALFLLKDFDNLVIVRTFSKSLSFAGMRLGFAVASPALIQTILTVKNSFNHFPVDMLTQMAGAAACTDAAWYKKNVQAIVFERELFSGFLKENGWDVLPSEANFVFARHNGWTGHDLYIKIKERGILVRHFATPGIDDFIRITIGTGEEMAKLKAVLREII